MWTSRTFALVVGALIAGGSPRGAGAFDEELQLGLDVAYAHESTGGEAQPGVGVRLRFRYGLNDMFAIAFALGWAGHPVGTEAGGSPIRHVATTEVGAVYAFDVERIVPYVSVLIGAAFRHHESNEAAFSVDLGGGLDWLLTSGFSLGLEVAYQILVGAEELPTRLLVSLRLNWHRAP